MINLKQYTSKQQEYSAHKHVWEREGDVEY